SIVNDISSDAQETAQDISNITLKDDGDESASKQFLWKEDLPTSGTRKEDKVGSLSFSVTSATRADQSTKAPTKQSAEDAGSSDETTAEQILRTKKPIARTKVPFEKGYSQMDWLKLTRTHPDLAGLKGQSNRRLISMSEVKQNRTEGSMWTVLKGRVYDIYPYMKFHPGGVDMLMKAVGKDSTSLFNKYHAWVNYEFLMEKCLVGILDETSINK
ncbi:hypothetical protein V2J09_015852, partial [Rumex salicifolius]